MKFLLQKDVLLDFIFALQKSKEWWDWWRPGDNVVEFVESGCSKDICPIGSLEFCLDYYRALGISLHPINIPQELSLFTGGVWRMLPNDVMEGMIVSPDSLWPGHQEFIKSDTKFKYPGNGLYQSFSEFKKTEYYDQDDTYQVSVYIPDILNEWRIFVLGGEVLDCKCYFSDDPFDIKAPSSDRVREIIKQINLPAFTLDIATSHYRKDIIIEVHDFFSCGLYGFADYNKLPYMFYRSNAHKFL